MNIFEDDASQFQDWNDEVNGSNEVDENVIDFYAILNVPRDATIDDINKAFKQRCLLFHPDRHMDETNRREATKIFVIMKRAQEVLSDPKLRSIYDTLGVKGIEMEGWALFNRSTNPENIRREYDFLCRLRDNEIMLQKVKPSTSFVVFSSISGLFRRTEDYELNDRFTLLGMKLDQNASCAIGSTNRLGLSGQVRFNEKGLGSGHFQTFFNWAASSYTQLQCSLALGPTFINTSSKLALTVPQTNNKIISWLTGSSLVLQPTIQYNPVYGDFNFILTPFIEFPLGGGNRGMIALNINKHPALILLYVRNKLNHPQFSCNFTISPILPSLQLTYHFRDLQNELTYKANCLLSLAEFTPSLLIEKRLTKYSKVGVRLLFSFPSFLLQASFRIRTGLNNYEFCLTLCEQQEDILPSCLYGVILPYVFLNITRLLFQKKISRLWDLLTGNQLNGDQVLIDMKKEQAQKAIELMRSSAERVENEEKLKNGLVIVQGLYGQMQNDRPSSELYPLLGDKVVDVTIPLQAFVHDSQLRIYTGKDQIPGFFDPCPGEPKMLKVLYRFGGHLHSVSVLEDQPLMLPMKTHRVSQ
ncbi:J domain-containing protein [Meloidogyne graminicola]|uniref:J domain-containing protein n=1 Tax=Meloidogyne graminicola TaxID=189291 RepID=A0A8S9ZJA7_9BILA|nr:J domain-containing protein [Meloidogyne graminicola]